jgi:hypothetical protein
MIGHIEIRGEINRRYRVESVLKVAETYCIQTEDDILKCVKLIKDHEGTLIIECFHFTKEYTKSCIELMFEKIWELFNECCIEVTIEDFPKISVWANIYIAGFSKELIIEKFDTKELALYHKNHRTRLQKINTYIKTIEITNEP